MNGLKEEFYTNKHIFEGGIIKQGWSRKNWKARWFVLDEDGVTLAYFANKKTFKRKKPPKGIIILESCLEVEKDEEVDKYPYTFKIGPVDFKNASRYYRFVTATEPEQQNWMSILSQCVKNIGKEQKTSVVDVEGNELMHYETKEEIAAEEKKKKEEEEEKKKKEALKARVENRLKEEMQEVDKKLREEERKMKEDIQRKREETEREQEKEQEKEKHDDKTTILTVQPEVEVEEEEDDDMRNEEEEEAAIAAALAAADEEAEARVLEEAEEARKQKKKKEEEDAEEERKNKEAAEEAKLKKEKEEKEASMADEVETIRRQMRKQMSAKDAANPIPPSPVGKLSAVDRAAFEELEALKREEEALKREEAKLAADLAAISKAESVSSSSDSGGWSPKIDKDTPPPASLAKSVSITTKSTSVASPATSASSLSKAKGPLSKLEPLDPPIPSTGLTGKDALLYWINIRIAPYGLKARNFTTSWKDGLAFCALLHSYEPSLYSFYDLDSKNDDYNLNLAFDSGEKIGLESYLDAEDITEINIPDSRSIQTYLMVARKFFNRYQPIR